MSVLLMGNAFLIEMVPARKLVLLYLANRADDDGGSCYPSQSTIARYTGLSTRCIREHTRALEEDGYVATEQVKANGTTHLVYRLNADRIIAEGMASREPAATPFTPQAAPAPVAEPLFAAPQPAKVVPPKRIAVTEADMEQLRHEYRDVPQREFDESVALCQGSRGYITNRNQLLVLQNWLRRDAERWRSRRQQGAPLAQSTNPALTRAPLFAAVRR